MTLRRLLIQISRVWWPESYHPPQHASLLRRSRALFLGSIVTVTLSILVAANILVFSAPARPLVPVLVGQNAEVVAEGGWPWGIAVDAAGTLVWADPQNGRVLALFPGRTKPTVLLDGLDAPAGVALDTEGNVYYTEPRRGTVHVLPAGSATPRPLLDGLEFPTLLSVDAAGQVFLLDGPTDPRYPALLSGPYCNERVVKLDPAAGTRTTLARWTGEPIARSGTMRQFAGLGGLFVHASGDVYYTTCKRGNLERLPRDSLNSETIWSETATSTLGIWVDDAHRVFFIQAFLGVRVLASEAGGALTVGGGGGGPYQLVVDRAGNVYFTDPSSSRVYKILASQITAALDREASAMPWPFLFSPTHLVYAALALPLILGAWITYGRQPLERTRQWLQNVAQRFGK